MNREQLNNSMRLESYDLQKFAGQVFALNAKRIAEELPEEILLKAKKIIAAGCGDSYCAAFSAKKVFEDLVGIPMFGVPAIEVSRHFSSEDLEDCIFFGISSRGRTSRVLEAAQRINTLTKNSTTVAIVNFKVQDSLLEKKCDYSLHIEMPVFDCGEYTEHAPCQRSYFSTMFTLMMIAIRMGQVKGNYDEVTAEKYREKLIKYAEKFDNELMDSIDDRMWELANKWEPFKKYEVVSSGYEFANGWFGAAKVVEAFGDAATYEHTDNWCDICRYAKNPESIGTIVIVDADNNGYEATTKVVDEMIKVGRPVIVITSGDKSDFNTKAEIFEIPSCDLPFGSTLMQYSPLGNLLGYIAKMRGASFYRYGGENDWYIKKLQDKIGDAITEQPITIIK